MGTKILNDIRNDLKLLIKQITDLEEDEEGFALCERYALSQIKHHRFLSVNSHATKKEISELVEKFQIHGKYEVAKKFQELIDSFLNNFDFERHPQYDIQWSLLNLLLNLSTETSNSDLLSLEQIANVPSDENKPEDIDWAEYLKEGEEAFFSKYQSSSSDSDWTDDEDVECIDLTENDQLQTCSSGKDLLQPISDKESRNKLEKLSACISDKLHSENWLESEIQHSWWNELNQHQLETNTKVSSARFFQFWKQNALKNQQFIGTLSEYQTCRELLWMFHVQKPMAIFESKALDFSVRDNMSVPSLTAAAFKNYLQTYCYYFTMIHELQEFNRKLYAQSQMLDEAQKPPLTFEAYNNAVQLYVLQIKEQIIELERKLIIQESFNTFLTMSEDLRRHLNLIKILYEIHKSATEDWETCSNWLRASKLLSTLYCEMQKSSSHERTHICANLYLSSIVAYLNIVDAWLSEGRLEDWRNEFIIVREGDRKSQEEEQQLYNKFKVRKLNEECLRDPIMQLFLKKVCQMGRNIELLVTLDRISDMWHSINHQDAEQISLNAEFRKEVVAEMLKYSVNFTYDRTDAVVSKEIIFPQQDLINDGFVCQPLISDNPFYMKSFEKYLPINGRDSYVCDETDYKLKEKKKTESSLFLFELESKSFLPLRKIFEIALSKILNLRHVGVNKLVKQIMIKEYKLEENLRLMRSIFMMEKGHVMNKFCNQMFNEIESNINWNNSHFLSVILEEVISEEWPKLSSRWSITVDNVRTHQVLNAVNGITLNYSVGWPVNLLLNEETINKYNIIFRFVLKLKWVVWTLNSLKFSDLEGSKSEAPIDEVKHFQMRRLECLRFWLLHAIGAIHIYLSGQVLQSLGNALDIELTQADNFYSIIKIHKEYLNKVLENSLQTSQFGDLMSTINQLLEMCISIRDTWKRGYHYLEGKKLDLLESTYIKYHTCLASALRNAVQHHNFAYLSGLTSAFNYSMPTT